MNFELPRLMVITNRGLAEEHGVGIDDALVAAASAGAKLFQVRDKGLTPGEFGEFAFHVIELLAGFRPTIVINDRADVALAIAADGVHRPGSGIPLELLRRLMEYRLVGASCHSMDEVQDAVADHADYATLSPIFETASKPGYGPALGIARLERTCRAVDRPVFALGGVTPENAGDCIDAGAHGVAVMGGIMRSQTPYETTLEYLRALNLR